MITRLFRKFVCLFLGKCFFKGHKWRMEKGWTNQTGDSRLAKPWVHYVCRRCGAIGTKEKYEART